MTDPQKMGIDASEMLAAALEQMDGIIASTCPDAKLDYPNGTKNHNTKSEPMKAQYARACRLMQDLKTAIELCDDKNQVMINAPISLLEFFQMWHKSYSKKDQQTDSNTSNQNGEAGSYHCPTAEEKIENLESDKQSLSLQVSVLSDQVEAQAEKIRELEHSFDDNRKRLLNTEEMYQSELLTKTTLETHKLDLMAEISNLKIKIASIEKDRKDLDDKLRFAQRHITELEAKLMFKDAEISDLKHRLTKNGTVLPPDHHYPDHGLISDHDRTVDRLRRKQTEVEKLKKAVDTLMVSNEEKDRKIDELKRLLRRYKRIQDLVLSSQGKKGVDDILALIDDDNSSTSSTTPSVPDATVRENPHAEEFRPERQYLPSPSATSTPVHYPQLEPSLLISNPLASPVSAITASTPKRHLLVPGVHKSNSLEDLPNRRGKTPPTVKKKDGYQHGYGTLPKHRSYDEDQSKRRAFPTLGKTLLRIRSGKRSSSAPNLARTEVVTDDEDGLQHFGPHTMQHETKKKKGLRRFFGRLKRSSSQDFDSDRLGEFKRGGTRATASARLGWTRDLKSANDMSIPFSRWDSERVTAWMNDIGLNMYLVECRRWVKHGEQLLRASSHDLEKELGIKSHLHRKKLQLALQAIAVDTMDKFSLLDYNWVTRWLDDIGLPQYKDNFYDGRIDARMVHYMTVEDLLALKVTNELHHISIKQGIKILRLNGFNQQCLKRRPSPEEPQLQNVPREVMLWTNHRVMEWLRTIDLSEYAPNLRGSGVHGALMVLEPRFNAELFAQVLSIPSSKTLLRRHLSTHFVSLIGNEMQLRKRECESSSGFVPLLVSSKIKKTKHGIFGHKRSKSESEADGFICPMETSVGNQTSNGNCTKSSDKKAAKDIGVYSNEINSLTSMLSHENFFERVPTSNV